LYRRYADRIYRYVYSRVKDASAAEDLTAEVFLRALESLPHYQPTGAPFRAWLYRIAHARTVDYWRRQQRRQEQPLEESLPAHGPQPEEVVSLQTEWDRALTLLSQLTDDQQQVIILRFVEGLELAEIAAMMEKTVGAVKALQYRALASLARLMEGEARLTP